MTLSTKHNVTLINNGTSSLDSLEAKLAAEAAGARACFITFVNADALMSDTVTIYQ